MLTQIGQLDATLQFPLRFREQGNVAEAEGFFPEEERSKQPSVFSLVRTLRELFSSEEDAFLGLYGAFGYDLAFQFEKIKLHKDRDGKGPGVRAAHAVRALLPVAGPWAVGGEQRRIVARARCGLDAAGRVVRLMGEPRPHESVRVLVGRECRAAPRYGAAWGGRCPPGKSVLQSVLRRLETHGLSASGPGVAGPQCVVA